jgi:hypothetical protein
LIVRQQQRTSRRNPNEDNILCGMSDQRAAFFFTSGISKQSGCRWLTAFLGSYWKVLGSRI